MSNTFKTYMGFLGSIVKTKIPSKKEAASLSTIFNYLQINEWLSTSGQPSKSEFETIKNAGFEVVVNLAPQSVMENALKNEAEILASLGLEYVHIPVDFIKPTEQNFQSFADSLKQASSKKVWVHCAANMRVSAFVYRYRVKVLEENQDTAQADLEKIWQPFGAWKQLIGIA